MAYAVVHFLPQAIRGFPKVARVAPAWAAGKEPTSCSPCGCTVIVGFFSFSTRQDYYTIPALPGMALLVGGWLAKNPHLRKIRPSGVWVELLQWHSYHRRRRVSSSDSSFCFSRIRPRPEQNWLTC